MLIFKMTQAQLSDFRKRQSGSAAPINPIKDLPRLAKALEVFATTSERKAALKKLDSENEDWRKSLGVTLVG